MLTTEGFSRSATSANDTSAGDRAAAARVRAGTNGALGAEIAGCGVIDPATMSPMRKAIVAVRQTVTTTNRRVMLPIIALLNQLQKTRFIEPWNAERPPFLGLGARLCPDNDRGRLLTDRVADLCAEAFERGRSRFARHGLQGACNDVGLAGEPSGPLRRDALLERDLHGHARGPKAVDELPVARLVEPAAHRFRQHGTDFRGVLQLLDRRGAERVHRSEGARQDLRCALSHMPNPETVNEPPQFVGPALVDLQQHLRGRLLAHALELLERAGGQRIDVGIVADEASPDHLCDERFAQPFDVHRATRGEVLEAALQLRGA